MRMGTIPVSKVGTGAGATNKWVGLYWTAMEAVLNAWIAPLTTPGGNNTQLVILSKQYWVDFLASAPAIAYQACAAINDVIGSEYVRHQDSRDAPSVP